MQTVGVSEITSLPTREAYAAIGYLYEYFNRELFGGCLPTCLFTFQRKPKMMGYFSRKRWVNQDQYVDELAINPEFFYGCPLEELCQTVVHEQCHVWQAHFGTPSRRSYHNKEWAEKMESLGLIPSSTGVPGGAKVGQKMDDYILSGGPIHLSIQALLKSGFRLKWVDTMPAFRLARPAKIYDQRGIKTGVASMTVIGSLVRKVESVDPASIEIGEDLPVIKIEVGYQESVRPIQEPAQHPDSDMVEILLAPLQSAAKKPQTRVKYRCSCDNQVWGRPKLNLTCNDCSSLFTECSIN